MFLYSRGSRGSYWPKNERGMTAVILFSSSSDLGEHKHPLFFSFFWCMIQVFNLLASSNTSWLTLILRTPTVPLAPPHFISSRPLGLNPPRASSFVFGAHPCRQSGQPFAPAVVCVVSVVTRLRSAWREMRPDCACGGQQGVSWVMCLVSGWSLREMQGNREEKEPPPPPPPLTVGDFCAPHMHGSGMSLSQPPIRHAVNHHQQHHLLRHLPLSCSSCLSARLSDCTSGSPLKRYFSKKKKQLQKLSGQCSLQLLHSSDIIQVIWLLTNRSQSGGIFRRFSFNPWDLRKHNGASHRGWCCCDSDGPQQMHYSFSAIRSHERLMISLEGELLHTSKTV